MIDRRRPGARATQGSPAAAREAALREALQLSVRLARAGEHAAARAACGLTLLEAQPALAADDELLRLAVHALLLGRGFALLSRLLRALRGAEVHFELLAQAGPRPARPLRLGAPGRTVFVLEPGWLAGLAPQDPFVRQWRRPLPARQDAPAMPRLQPA